MVYSPQRLRPCKEGSRTSFIRTDSDSSAAAGAAKFSFTAPIFWDSPFTVFGKGRSSSFTCPGNLEKIFPTQWLCARHSLNYPRVTGLCRPARPLVIPAYESSLHFAHHQNLVTHGLNPQPRRMWMRSPRPSSASILEGNGTGKR